MKRYFEICCFLLILGYSSTLAKTPFGKKVAATNAAVSITGRTLTGTDGSVSFDWGGVYLQTFFTGGTIAVEMSDTKRDFFNVFIDDVWKEKIEVTGTSPKIITLAKNLSLGSHKLKLQKSTEGSQGCTTIYGFFLAANGKLGAVVAKKRLIEMIGDSYSCGYGVEAQSAQDHFKAETEDCNKAYGPIIASYFDADYVLIAHSGRGVARNYGDSLQVSPNNMNDLYLRVFDDAGTQPYNFSTYHPNLVTINLGTNDYSPGNIPTAQQLADNYLKLIQSVRSHYPSVPVLCIIPHSANKNLTTALDEVKTRISKLDKVFMTNPMPDIVTNNYDLGADFHPNYQGQRKIAMTLIPQISAIMSWPLENKIIK